MEERHEFSTPTSESFLWAENDGTAKKGRGHGVAVLAILISLAIFYHGCQRLLAVDDEFDGATGNEPVDSFIVEQYGLANAWRIRSEMISVDCEKYFASSRDIPKGNPMSEHPLEMHCDAIRSRILPFRSSNTGFPIAYTKAVYMDYELLEEQLAVSFALENSYCFVIDSKAKDLFKRRLRRLARCLPNVIVLDEEMEMDRYGHNQNRAHLACIRRMMTGSWKYVMLLQNHDILLKSHRELYRIFTILNGTSDIEVSSCAKIRCEPFLDTSVQRLGLFPTNNSPVQHLRWAKGAQQCSLSREAASYIINRIDVASLVKQLNFLNEGVDEILLPSLAISEIGFPGGYTAECLPAKNTFITRLSKWRDNATLCASGRLRHYICVLGTGDLLRLSRAHHLIANKMMPQVDYTAIHCMSQLVFNRSRKLSPSVIDDSFYAGIHSVRYNKYVMSENTTSAFEC